MSCLNKQHRINSSREFSKIYKSNKRWHSKSFVAFFIPNNKLNIAFIASKKVGNAVFRNRAKRLLRALALKYENTLPSGKYVFVAKGDIFLRDFKTLENDFKYTLKKINTIK